MSPRDDKRSDAQLIDAINRGDTAAFEALYRRHRDWVVASALRYTRDADLALDVMQETFIYVLGKFPGFTLTARFTTFLYPVVRHIAIRQRDKAARTRGEPPEDSVAAAEPAGNPREALAELMADLSEEHRETLLLRFVDGFTMQEIAAAMGVPDGTVKSRIHHALRLLREDDRVREYFDPDR